MLILGFESSTFTYISMLKKFGHFLMNSSRDTGGGLQEPPPVRGKDILIPYGIGLKILHIFFCSISGNIFNNIHAVAILWIKV